MIEVPVVFTIDRNFLSPAYVAITSLVDTAFETTIYDIIVLYQGAVDDGVILYEIVKNNRHKMQIFDVSYIRCDAWKTTKTWPSIVFIRLFLSAILDKYDKVIYSDVDVLFLGDLSGVFLEDMTGYEWAGVAAEKNSKDTVMHQHFSDNHRQYIYWDGFMVMNLYEMRKNNWLERCRSNLEKYKDKLYMCDLEILNLTATNIKRLPFRYVYLQALFDTENITDTSEWKWLSQVYSEEELKQEKENVIIVHYAGKVGRIGKPWLRFNPPEYYKKYLTILPLSLKRINNMNKLWKNIKAVIRIVLEKLHICKKGK